MMRKIAPPLSSLPIAWQPKRAEERGRGILSSLAVAQLPRLEFLAQAFHREAAR